LPQLQGKTVLSLGCGSGEDSNYLKKAGAEKSVGIDVSNSLLTYARDAYSECEFLEMDMEKLSFENESFDFAYSSLAIHYIEDWTETFKEVFRVLRPNSYFLCSCNHPTRFSIEILNKGTSDVMVVEDYLHRKKISNVLGKNTVNAWHKPLWEIISELQSADFVIDTIVEPKPLETLKGISLKDYERLSKVPEFIIFRLLKP
jgi:ubiquinone/menaquinone biosynthesis C-methylase UbiE